MNLNWQKQRWEFRFTIIQSNSIEKVHFKALGANIWKQDEDLWIYDYDSVLKLTYRETLVRMRRDKYVVVCGITYDKV